MSSSATRSKGKDIKKPMEWGDTKQDTMATVCRNLEEASPRGTGAKFVAVPKPTLEAKKTTKKRPASPTKLEKKYFLRNISGK